MTGGKTAVAWLAGFGGAGLVWASIHDRRPIAALTAAFGGTTSTAGFGALPTVDTTTAPAPTAATGTPGRASLTAAGTGSGSGGSGGAVPITATVVVGNNIRLVPACAASFVAWSAAFGQPIVCTGGWRSAAAENAGHAVDPKRFTSGDKSYHTAGKAVDVDMNWMGRLTAGQQSSLRRAAAANGWGQWAWAKGEAACGAHSSNSEPWHFSWGGCG